MRKTFTYNTGSDIEIIDITADITSFAKNAKIKEGICHVFVKSTTCALLIMENEEGIRKDLLRALDQIAPKDGIYAHNKAWRDNNGFSHLRAELLGQSLTIPVKKSALDLGTWQNIFLIDFDNKERSREIVATVISSSYSITT